jgi:hypothetical protein
MNVQLGTAIAAPGTRATGWLAVETAPGEQTQIPVVVINGGQPGPRLAMNYGDPLLALGGDPEGGVWP